MAVGGMPDDVIVRVCTIETPPVVPTVRGVEFIVTTEPPGTSVWLLITITDLLFVCGVISDVDAKSCEAYSVTSDRS